MERIQFLERDNLLKGRQRYCMGYVGYDAPTRRFAHDKRTCLGATPIFAQLKLF